MNRAVAYIVALAGILIIAFVMRHDARVNAPSPIPPLRVARSINGCTDAATLTVIASIQQRPGDWTFDGFVVGKKDVGVWVANDAEGVKITTGSDASDLHSNEGYKDMSDECRVILYKTAQQWQINDIRQRVTH